MKSKSLLYPDAKILLDSFEHAKNNWISTFDENITQLFESFIDYEKGREMCKLHLKSIGESDNNIENELKRIPATNFMLISLVDRIPTWAKLDGPVKITYYWIYFPSSVSESEIYARYCPDIHTFLLSFSHLITTDIFQEADRMSYFVNSLKNCYIIPVEPHEQKVYMWIDTINENKLTWSTENFDIKTKDTKNPLLHFLTWESLDEICGFSMRAFLIKMFWLLPENIALWTHIFFHDSGIYYRTKENSEIHFIQANQKYISHFEIEKTASKFIPNAHRWIDRRSKLISYEESIKKIVKDILNANYANIVTEHIHTSSPLDVFKLEMKDNFWVSVYVENLVRFPELHDWEKLKNLVQIFMDIAPVMRNYFQNGMFFGRNLDCKKDASLPEIGIAFKRNQSELLSQSFMKQYFLWWTNLDGTPIHPDIYIHEYEYLQKYEQYYPFFMYLFFWRVFKKLLHLAKENSVYKDVLKNIHTLVDWQLNTELQSLNRNWFNPKSELAKDTVLINYFMRYCCAYIMERKWKPLKVTIPEGWRIFLRDKIFFDHERIS